jgi:NADH-quinone oxidoreductase subunit B
MTHSTDGKIEVLRPLPPHRGRASNVVVKGLEHAVSWGRKFSLWPYTYGTACCGIELMAALSSQFDIARYGAELVRFSPRQSDLLIIAGTIVYKQAPILKRIYDQMAEPKWVIAMGACASSGGFYRNYHTLQGADHVVPVDVYIGGCPPRPQAIFDGVMLLQEKIEREGFARDRHGFQEREHEHVQETEESE